MSRLPSLRAVPWLAAGGLLAGHAVATAVTTPHGASADLHGYLAWAGLAGTVAATLGSAALLTVRLAGGGRPSFGQLAGRLAAIQSVGFAVMETTERVANHASVHDLVTVLPVGAAVQLAIALAIATVLRWLLRTADQAREVLAHVTVPARSAASEVLSDPVSAVRAGTRTSRRGRAPPAWAPPLPA